MNILCFSFKSKNEGVSSKSKDIQWAKRKGTIGQTMIYKKKNTEKTQDGKTKTKYRG